MADRTGRTVDPEPSEIPVAKPCVACGRAHLSQGVATLCLEREVRRLRTLLLEARRSA